MRIERVLILVVFVLSAGVALGVSTPTIRIRASDFSFEKEYGTGDITQVGDDTFYLEESTANGVFDASWNLTFKSEPYVLSWVSLKNTSSTNQTYTVTFIEPVSPAVLPSSLYGGSVGGSLSTDPAGGFVSTVAPEPLFLGMLDGVGMLELYSHPSSWTLPGRGTTIIDEQSAWGLMDGPVMSSIGIQHMFELGPGDVVALTGYFEANVPEPATICLLGLGGLALLKKRRA